MTEQNPGEKPWKTPPDAFFPNTSRGMVVLLGVLMLVGGAIATAAVLIYIPPFTDREIGRSGNLSLIFFAGAVGLAIFGAVCLVKKPTKGSAPGSDEYNRLIEKDERSVYRSMLVRSIIGLVLSAGATIYLLTVGLAESQAGAAEGRLELVSAGVTGLISGFSALFLLAVMKGWLPNIKPPKR